ncbi:MAG: phosphoglycerate kinase [Alphaproteobacteria bacterium]
MTDFLTLKDFALEGKTILLRADLNVPAQNRKVTDTTRIDRLKPTIDALCSAGARVLILSHFGRPEGDHNPEMSLAFLCPVLQERWGRTVRFAADCIGEPSQRLAESLQNGEIGLLENVRFHKEETKNDLEFARKLAALGDIYVNDAFSAAHRAHASTEKLAHLLPSAAGLLMEEELTALGNALETPQKPLAAIAGGSKISTKLAVLNNLVTRVDYLILGGGMANTFLAAQGANMGASLCEHDMLDEARTIMATADKNGCKIILPEDFVCVRDLHQDAAFEICTPAQGIPDDLRAIDIGEQTITTLCGLLEECRTVLWNGPMGVFEIKPFDNGTNALAQKAAALTKAQKILSVAGGGDTVAALENAGCLDGFSYVSSAGGAFLEWLQGESLPGVIALSRHKNAA